MKDTPDFLDEIKITLIASSRIEGTLITWQMCCGTDFIH
jgi:hypothetical protein